MLLLIIGFEQIIIQQFIMASSSNKAILCVGIVGVIIGVSMNMILTPKIASVGSALAWGCSESGVLCSGVYLAKRVMNLSFNKKMILRKLVESFIFLFRSLCFYSLLIIALNLLFLQSIYV